MSANTPIIKYAKNANIYCDMKNFHMFYKL